MKLNKHLNLKFKLNTSNMYKLTKNEYKHLLDNAVTRTCKKATKGIEGIINKEGIKYAKQGDMFDRIDINGTFLYLFRYYCSIVLNIEHSLIKK